MSCGHYRKFETSESCFKTVISYFVKIKIHSLFITIVQNYKNFHTVYPKLCEVRDGLERNIEFTREKVSFVTNI